MLIVTTLTSANSMRFGTRHARMDTLQIGYTLVGSFMLLWSHWILGKLSSKFFFKFCYLCGFCLEAINRFIPALRISIILWHRCILLPSTIAMGNAFTKSEDRHG